MVLGSGEYARIKTETKPHIGRDGEPIAEKTKLGWFIMSPGQEFDRPELECLNALKDMEPDKSPGTDGLPSEFLPIFLE